MTLILKRQILYLSILVHLVVLGYCNDCGSFFSFVCSSSEIKVTLKGNATDSFYVTAGNVRQNINDTSYTVQISNLDYVTLLEGFLVKLEKENNYTCLILCKNESAKTSSNVATSYFLPEQQNEVGDVDMRIRETSSENSQEISEAYLGDTIFMFLKYVGKSNYTIFPLDCTAYDGNFIPDAKSNMSLWQSSSCTRTKYFSPFKVINRKTVYAEMYAFKFKGSEDITFACNVKICMSCQYRICNKTTKIVRRKRSGHRQKHLHTGTTLRITNRPVNRNKIQVSDAAHMTVKTAFHLVIVLLYILLK